MTLRMAAHARRLAAVSALALGFAALLLPSTVSGTSPSLTLSRYSGYRLTRITATYHGASLPGWNCDYAVIFEWDDVSAGLPPTKLSSHCTASGPIVVPLIKGYGDYGKHKVCVEPQALPFGPGGPRTCRTFTILAKVVATPRPTPTPTGTPAPTSKPEPTLGPTLEPTGAPTAMPTLEPTVPAAPTPSASDSPSTAPDANDSSLGFVAGAFLGGLILVVVAVRVLRPKRSAGG